FGSCSGLSFRHPSTSTINCAYATRATSDRGCGSLMSDVFCCCCVNGVLGNVGSMIANPFEAAPNKNQIQVAPQLIRALLHSIGHALEVRGKFHRRIEAAQIGRNWLKAQQNIHAVLVDLLLHLVDLFVVGDCSRGNIVVAIDQTLHCPLQTTLSEPSHHEHVVTESRERFIECS